MARAAKTAATKTPTKKPAGRSAKPGTSAKAAVKKPAKTTKPAPIKATATPRKPVVGKADLRAAIEKLEAQNATLRTKNREANKALKTAHARIAELEATAEKPAPKAVTAKAPAAKKPVRKKATPVTEAATDEAASQPETVDTAPTE